MAFRIVDDIAYAGGRFSTNVSGTNAVPMVAAIATAAGSGGWTIGGSAGGTYTCTSQQSPWFDNSPPGTYTGMCRMVLDPTNGNHINFIASTIDGSFTAANGIPTFDVRASTAILVCCNPFQIMGYDQTNGNAVICGVPHTPVFVQTGLGLSECIYFAQANGFASSLFNSAHAIFSLIKGTSGTFKNDSATAGTSMLFAVQGGAQSLTSGNWLWNRNDDSGMTDPSKWYGFLTPPMLAWNVTSTSSPTLNAFLWDSVVINRDYGGAATTTLTTPDGHFLVNIMSSNTGNAHQPPGSLFFCTGTNTDTF